MQDIKYVNHLGEEVSLGRGTYKMLKDTSLLNYDWTHLTKNEYDPTVYAFSRSLVEKDISIRIQSESKSQYIKDLNYLHEIFEKDIYAVTPGEIVIGDYHLSCYITAKTMSKYYPGALSMVNQYKVLSETGRWYHIVEKVFGAGDQNQIINTGARHYPRDYKYDYAHAFNTNRLISDSFVPFDFEIIYNGPWDTPSVTVSNYTYRVYTELAQDEYLTVNSKTKTIVKTKKNGEKVNEFYLRDRDNYIFEKMKATNGSSYVSVPEGKICSIKAFTERSEPKWI